MDSISGTLKIGFQITSTDSSVLNESYQLLLGIVGTFSVLVGPKTLYEEVEFCLVEFAMHISKWLNDVATINEDFSYKSLESEEGDLVWIRSAGDGWLIGSVHQNYPETKSFSIDELRNAINQYLNELKVELDANFGLGLNLQARSVNELFGGRP